MTATLIAALEAALAVLKDGQPQASPPVPDSAITYADAAQLLSVHPSQVGKLAAAGQLEGFKIGRRGRRVTRKSVEALIRRRSA